MDFKEKELNWDEYKYRHSHVWKTVFSLTGSLVILSIIPYVNTDMICILGNGAFVLVLPPLLGFALWFFGYFRIEREMKLLSVIKERHRCWQKVSDSNKPDECKKFSKEIQDATKNSSFDRHVKNYLCALLFGAFINNLFVFYWISTVITDYKIICSKIVV